MATLKNGNVTVSFADTYQPPENQTVLYNALGRGAAQNQGGGFNPFSWVGDKINAAANTFGTTISAGADALRSGIGFIGGIENRATDNMRRQNKSNLDEVYKSIGFQGRNDFINQLSQAESSGNQEEADRLMALEQSVNEQLQNVANQNAATATNKANAYQDYRKNSYVGQKVNQDAGKYLGDAINTWSTMADIAGMASGAPFLMLKNRVAGNALQGALGGIANELSQNGFENFDWGRAGQNAVIGGISGAATAGLNQKWQPKAAGQITSKGLKGALERGLNSQIGRGAVSGAVGGAIGGGLSAGMNGGDVMSGAMQGASQGAVSGATSSALMQGANKLGGAIVNRIDKTGGLADRIANNQQAYNKWLNAGNTFNERLNNTITSGESSVGNWLTKGGPKNLAKNISDRGIGLSIKPVAPQFDRKNGKVEDNLAAIKDAIAKENVSYDELAYLQEHTPEIIRMGDTELAEWAGIPEDYWNATQTSGTTGGNQSVRDWYMKNYADDKLGAGINPNLTFDELKNALQNGQDIYQVIGGDADTVIRERLFDQLVNQYGGDYDDYYNQWLEGGNNNNRRVQVETVPEYISPELQAKAQADQLFSIMNDSDRTWNEFINRFQNLTPEARDYILSNASAYGLDFETQRTLDALNKSTNIPTNEWLVQRDANMANLEKAREYANEYKNDRAVPLELADIEAAQALGVDPKNIKGVSRANFWAEVAANLEDTANIEGEHIYKPQPTQTSGTPQLRSDVVQKWYNTIDSEDPDAFLDFMEGMNVNEAVNENGERVIYFENGMYGPYEAHGFRLGENDSPMAKAIIDEYEAYGGEYRPTQTSGDTTLKELHKMVGINDVTGEPTRLEEPYQKFTNLKQFGWGDMEDAGFNTHDNSSVDSSLSEADVLQGVKDANVAHDMLSASKRTFGNDDVGQELRLLINNIDDAIMEGNYASSAVHEPRNYRVENLKATAKDLNNYIGQLKSNQQVYNYANYDEYTSELLNLAQRALDRTNSAIENINHIDTHHFGEYQVTGGELEGDAFQDKNMQLDKIKNANELSKQLYGNKNWARTMLKQANGSVEGYNAAVDELSNTLGVDKNKAQQILENYGVTQPAQKQAVSIADFQEQGLGPRKAEQAAYKNLINGYFGEDSGYDSADGIANAILEAEGGADPQSDVTNFAKARRMVENGFMAIYPEDELNELKSIYGDSFKESTYKNKDGSWKYKNGERYIDTIYKNKIAMALSKEMDARQSAAETPTAKDWAKQAVKRIGDKGVGLSVKDVSQDDNNPETELYRKLTQSSQDSLMGKDIAPENENENDITGVFDSNKYGKMQKRNWLQATGDDYLRAAEQQKYLGMLGQLEGPTAKDAMARQIPQKLAEIGIKPENYGEFAKTSSYINGVIDDMAERSNVRVNLPNLASELDYDNLKDIVIDSPAAVNKYQTNIKSIVAEGSNPGEYTVSQLMDASRRMNRLANSTTNQDLKKAYTNAKYTLRNAATKAMDEAGLFGDATDNRIAKGLADMGASQAVQDYYTAAVDGRSPNATDYIARTAPAEVARKIDVEMRTEPYVRSASKEPTRFATKILRSSGLEPLLNTTLRKTVAPLASNVTKLAGKTLRLAGDIQAAPNLLPENQTLLYNALGRYATENELGNGANNANMAVASTDTEPVALLASNGPAYASDTTSEPTTEETALYNSLTGGTTDTTSTPTMGTYSAGTQSTGNSMADTLLGAMDRAANAGDADAFATLYQMYANAVSSTNSNKDMTNPVNWNSADRTKLINAQNGLSQIDTLENAYVNATGNGGDFVSGNLRNFGNMISGGNLDPTASNYNDLAQSVGMGIIKNLVNLGVTESDAERYKQYLPALTDSAEKAQMKLETLRKIYQDQINNLYSTYNA